VGRSAVCGRLHVQPPRRKPLPRAWTPSLPAICSSDAPTSVRPHPFLRSIVRFDPAWPEVTQPRREQRSQVEVCLLNGGGHCHTHKPALIPCGVKVAEGDNPRRALTRPPHAGAAGAAGAEPCELQVTPRRTARNRRGQCGPGALRAPGARRAGHWRRAECRVAQGVARRAGPVPLRDPAGSLRRGPPPRGAHGRAAPGVRVSAARSRGPSSRSGHVPRAVHRRPWAGAPPHDDPGRVPRAACRCPAGPGRGP
jgi:hypothetical protein